jgi:hypothetical protein
MMLQYRVHTWDDASKTLYFCNLHTPITSTHVTQSVPRATISLDLPCFCSVYFLTKVISKRIIKLAKMTMMYHVVHISHCRHQQGEKKEFELPIGWRQSSLLVSSLICSGRNWIQQTDARRIRVFFTQSHFRRLALAGISRKSPLFVWVTKATRYCISTKIKNKKKRKDNTHLFERFYIDKGSTSWFLFSYNTKDMIHCCCCL